jgi:hypothetical protein
MNMACNLLLLASPSQLHAVGECLMSRPEIFDKELLHNSCFLAYTDKYFKRILGGVATYAPVELRDDCI